MAEVKKTVSKTAEKAEPKKVAPKKTATTKTAEAPKKAPAKKTATKVEVKEVAAKAEEVKVEAPKKAKASKNTVPMLKIKLVKSVNGRLEKQKRTIEALGLRKLGSETVKPDNAQTRGMIFVVKHLVTVESVKEN